MCKRSLGDLDGSASDPRSCKKIATDRNHLLDVRRAKSLLLSRLNGKELPLKLYGLDNEYNKLYSLLKQTVTTGESNSCVIIGNRGTGKSALVRSVIRDLQATQQQSVSSSSNPKEQQQPFCVIRLNGLTETNDRLALNEISRQLFEEQQRSLTEQVEAEKRSFSSFADSFEYLLSLLKAGTKGSLPVIFILDEFDLFAQHPKQALLYNLFDAAQSAQNPIAVIGLTCRLDALDLLEKRVKSRFSHRQLYLFPSSNFGQFLEVAKGTLTLPEEYAASEAFNHSLDNLFQTPTLNSIVRRIYDINKDIRMFQKICFTAVHNLKPEAPFFDINDFVESNLEQKADAKIELLKEIALLELLLIISMKKLLEKDLTTFNFQMVYEEYKESLNQAKLNNRGFGVKLFKKAVAFKAFENLQLCELVCPIDTAGKCPKEFRMNKLMLEPAQVAEAVLKYDCSILIKKWATGAA